MVINWLDLSIGAILGIIVMTLWFVGCTIYLMRHPHIVAKYMMKAINPPKNKNKTAA